MTAVLTRALAGLALLSLVATPAAEAQITSPIKSYATDKCVAGKQKALGKLCAGRLKALSSFLAGGDETKFDDAVGKAFEKAGASFTKSEEKATKKSADCSETGSSAAEINALFTSDIDTAAAALAGSCTDVGSVLKAAAKLCGSYFKAESKHMKKRAADPLREALALNKLDADAKFVGATTSLACDEAALNDFSGALSAFMEETALASITTTAVPTDSWLEIPGTEVVYGKETLDPKCAGGVGGGGSWESTPWKMWARRGNVNKLLIYFQGGGACWNNLTCGANQCDLTVGAGDDPNNFGDGAGLGLFDSTNPDNPFVDWHMVYIPYCTCDVHWGNKRSFYPGIFTPVPTVEHRGRINAAFAEKFAREHFVNPDQIMVTGSSAGGLGALFNSLWIHEAFPSSQVLTLGDAAAGVSSEEFRTNDIVNWGILGTLPRHVEGLDLDVFTDTKTDDVVIAGANHYASRESRVAEYNTYWDYVFTSFYNVMINPGDPTNWRASSCEYNEELLLMEDNLTGVSAPANIKTYLGSGTDHTMFFHPKVYTDAVPALAGGGDIALIDFINDMVANPPGPNWTNARCDEGTGGCDHVCTDFPANGFVCGGNPDKHQDGSTTPLDLCP